MDSPSKSRPNVVILGGGFGGLAAVRALKHAPVQVTLIDRSNHHVFQPLLYQVATAGLQAANVAYPLRRVVRHQRNTEVVMAEARAIDTRRQTVALNTGDEVRYDQLILATGSRPVYFGHNEWRYAAPSLKTLTDAIVMRHRILQAFELAEQARDPAEREALLRFIVVGGGPTGVELAGSLAELARHALKHDYRHIDTSKTKILLVQGGPAILPGYPPMLQRKAVQQLETLGVEVRTSARVESVDDTGVLIAGRHVSARTVLWATGVRATDIVWTLGVPLTRGGQVVVDAQLHPPSLTNVYVIGDLAALEQDGHPIPGVAPAAMQEGHYAANAIVRRLQGQPVPPFRYRNKGELATIGRSRAVAQLPHVRISGLPAWLTYLVVHLWYLVGFRNRVMAFLTWSWSYLTYSHGARIVPTEYPEQRTPLPPPPPQPPAPQPRRDEKQVAVH